MTTRAILRAAMLAATLVACRAEPPQNSFVPPTPEQGPQTGLEVVPIAILSGDRRHIFNVEVARTSEQQQIGLMFRESLAPNAGMIFPMYPPRPTSFWMKNTLIPLDMIFIRTDGTIARIAANTVPHSLDPVGVDEPVSAVLEIAGGRAAELGIAEGDRVVAVEP